MTRSEISSNSPAKVLACWLPQGHKTFSLKGVPVPTEDAQELRIDGD